MAGEFNACIRRQATARLQPPRRVSPVFPYLGKTSVKLLRDRGNILSLSLSLSNIIRHALRKFSVLVLVNDRSRIRRNDRNDSTDIDASKLLLSLPSSFFLPRIYSHGSKKQNVLPLSGIHSRGKKNTTIHARKSLNVFWYGAER